MIVFLDKMKKYKSEAYQYVLDDPSMLIGKFVFLRGKSHKRVFYGAIKVERIQGKTLIGTEIQRHRQPDGTWSTAYLPNEPTENKMMVRLVDAYCDTLDELHKIYEVSAVAAAYDEYIDGLYNEIGSTIEVNEAYKAYKEKNKIVD